MYHATTKQEMIDLIVKQRGSQKMDDSFKATLYDSEIQILNEAESRAIGDRFALVSLASYYAVLRIDQRQ